MGQEWRQLKEFPFYSINKEGQVRNKYKYIIKQSMSEANKPLVTMRKEPNGKRYQKCVHLLLSSAFGLSKKEQQDFVNLARQSIIRLN